MEEPRRRGRTALRAALLLAAGSLVAVVAVNALGIASGQTPSPSPSPGTKEGFYGAGARPFGHFHGGFGGIHGEFTTRAPGGGFQTLATQIGEVTSVSSSSIAVKSEDGFARTYSVNDNTLVNAGDDGISDIKEGHGVRVTAIVKDGKAAAVAILDLTTVGELSARWRPSHGPDGMRDGPSR